MVCSAKQTWITTTHRKTDAMGIKYGELMITNPQWYKNEQAMPGGI